MERTEWLARRKQGIGGSDVGAILGLSPWRTALDVYHDKTGANREEPETENMRIGTALEQFVADRFEEETGRKTSRFNGLLQVGHSIGNIDRLVVPEGARLGSYQNEIRTSELLECKTASTEWDGEVPAHYQAQVQHYMGLDPAFKVATVACLFLGFNKHFQTFRIQRDDSLIRSMQEAVEKFWTEHVEKNIPPAPQNEDDCRKLWARHEAGKVVEADDALAEVARNLREVSLKAKELEEQEKALRGQLMAALGDGETLSCNGVKLCTWKNNKPTEKTDWAGLAMALNPTPEQIHAYTELKPGARVFRLSVK